MKKTLLALVMLVGSSAATADVQLQIKDFRGTSTVSSNGQKARIEDGATPGYVIVDYAGGQIMMVDPQRNEVMSTTVRGEPAAGGGIDVGFKDKGGGQKIAGYSTRKYELLADGQNCGIVYASKKLLANGSIRSLFESMRNMQRATSGMMGGMASMMSPCQRANLQMADAMEAVGAPLKILDENGRLMSEVISVDTAKSLPANYYDLPPGMKVVDMQQMMQQGMQQSQQIMEQMPDMNELMKQIQQSGGQMDEDMQQQLQQMLEQLQQSQQ